MNALVILLSIFMFLLALGLTIWTRKQMQLFQQSLQSNSINQLVKRELNALNAGSIGLGERFIKLEKELHQLAMQLDDVQSQVSSNSPYAYAIELAQKGYNKETIAELCHISQTEAQLLVMMHQQQAA